MLPKRFHLFLYLQRSEGFEKHLVFCLKFGKNSTIQFVPSNKNTANSYLNLYYHDKNHLFFYKESFKCHCKNKILCTLKVLSFISNNNNILIKLHDPFQFQQLHLFAQIYGPYYNHFAQSTVVFFPILRTYTRQRGRRQFVTTIQF